MDPLAWRDKRVFIVGNGGSYANAMHIANDLLACRVRAFTMDPSTMSAFANDFGYDVAYSLWLAIVAEKGDVLIAMSGSGRSPNILNAIKTGEYLGMTVHRIFGAPELDMQQAEERQLALGHEWMRALK